MTELPDAHPSPSASPSVSSAPPAVAFFDVDETLISVNSMSRFLRHHLRVAGRSRPALDEAVRGLRTLAARGASRPELTRAYYRLYAGCDARELAAQGRAWFAEETRAGDLFLTATVAALREHRRRGETVVLVSGSFAPCLDPIAQWLGADEVLCARPESVEGVLTGGLDLAMLGEEKADAVRALLCARGVRADRCHAYGDHASDLAMLRAVGHPVVVGADPLLARCAEEHGWRRIPASAGPRSLRDWGEQRPSIEGRTSRDVRRRSEDA
ncbi:HAD family hydrolase [Streptomyces sp. NPDC102364]|uniref:HAD family hydrolase n=1 Tax=Streptomyces sp. NPDC102364 TaxID=3366161 RepID=UPI0038237053